MNTTTHLVAVLSAAVLAIACDGAPGSIDAASPPTPDAPPTGPDAASPPDATIADAGPMSDAPASPDGGAGPDAGPLPDAGPPVPDAGPPPVGDVLASPDYFDVVLDTDRHQVFFSYRDAKTVEVVDLDTGPVTALDTTWFAEHMYFDATTDRVVISLPVADHSPFWFDPDQEGYVGSINATSPVDPVPYYIPRDPWQIVADGAGYAYVAGGSGQSTNAVGIDLSTAVWALSSSTIADSSNIRLHPDKDRFYAVTGNLTPNSLSRRYIADGSIGPGLESPDDNDHDVCGDLRIHPWGTSIFTRCGHVFSADDTPGADMLWQGTIGTTWDDLTFDPTGAFAYVLTEGVDTLAVVDAQTLSPVTSLSIGTGVRRVLTGTNYLVLIRDVLDMGDPKVRAEVLPYSALRVDLDTQCSSSVSVNPPGTVCTDDCAELYPTGTSVTLTPAGAAAESFVGWTGPCSGTGPCTVTMDRARTIGAAFSGPTESVAVDFAGAGTGRVVSDRPGIDCTATCTANFVRDCEITLTAVPDPSSSFAGWSGDCTGTGTCTLPMDTAKSVTANFDAFADVLWSVHISASDHQGVEAVAVDGTDAVIAAGSFYGTPDFGGGPLTNAGQSDFYVARFLSDGTPDWAVSNGTTVNDVLWDMAIDDAGDIFVAGYYEGTLSFAATEHTSIMWADFFVAKYATDGTELWFRSFGSVNHDDQPLRLAVHSSGDVIVSGMFEGSVDFGAGAVVSGDIDDPDMFVARYDGSDGSLDWVLHYGPIGYSTNRIPVDLDTAGNILVSSPFRATVDLGGPSSLTAASGYDLFVAKYSGATGAHFWSKSAGGTGTVSSVSALSVDSADNIVIGGQFFDDIDFGGGILTSSGGGYLAQYEGLLGAYIDAVVHPAIAPARIGLNSAGAMVLVGQFYGTVDFGGGALTSAGESDMYVAKYDASGVYQWARTFGGTSYDGAWSVAFDSADNVVVGARVRGTFDLDGTTITSGGDTDILLFKLEP